MDFRRTLTRSWADWPGREGVLGPTIAPVRSWSSGCVGLQRQRGRRGFQYQAVNGTKYGKLERYLPTKEMVEVDAPVGITISQQGEIVVGQCGEVNKPKDSLLSFYSAKTGKMLKNQETGLYDITGLAYSPKTGLLYATDFAWMAPAEGGLFGSTPRRGVKADQDRQPRQADRTGLRSRRHALRHGRRPEEGRRECPQARQAGEDRSGAVVCGAGNLACHTILGPRLLPGTELPSSSASSVPRAEAGASRSASQAGSLETRAWSAAKPAPRRMPRRHLRAA